MLVGERMSHPVITIRPDLPIIDALNLMKREKIRRAPVVRKGALIGIVSDADLLNASPSAATALSIWEMNHLLSKVTVEKIMSKDVLTVTENTPIEEAARTMVDNKIGGLPVIRDSKIVGIITETDLFKIFLELMGAREFGVRVTAIVQEEPGQLAKLTRSITEAGGNFLAFGQFAGEDPTNRLVTFKVEGVTEEELRTLIEPLVEEIIDLRVTPT